MLDEEFFFHKPKHDIFNKKPWPLQRALFFFALRRRRTVQNARGTKLFRKTITFRTGQERENSVFT